VLAARTFVQLAFAKLAQPRVKRNSEAELVGPGKCHHQETSRRALIAYWF
jgi:hypothetical protein